MKPLVRCAGRRDIARLFEIDAACGDNPWTYAQLEGELSNRYARLLCAEDCGEVAGFCDIHMVFENAHINSLRTAPEHRRRGVASALLEAALEAARRVGCEFATLEVRSKNLPAILLYQKLGFGAVGRRAGFYTLPDDDALTMRREL